MDSNKKLPKIKQSGVIQIRGKDVTTYESKLDYAHQNGVKSLKVEILQFPSEQNGQMCFCQAELVTADDRVFSDIAEASPHNVPRGCADSFPRIASTRAKSRVISDAFNIKSVMSDDVDVPPEGGEGEYIIDADFTDITDEKTQYNRAKNGGGAKPASDKQLALISSLARNQNSSPEDIAGVLGTLAKSYPALFTASLCDSIMRNVAITYEFHRWFIDDRSRVGLDSLLQANIRKVRFPDDLA